MEKGRTEYLPLSSGRKDDKGIELVLGHFRNRELWDEFYRYFRELEELYEILSPDPSLRPFLEDYQDRVIWDERVEG